jgi:hypothetical protein
MTEPIASRKAPSVWDAVTGEGVADKVTGSMRRAAELRKDMTTAEKHMDGLCERMMANQEEAQDAGIGLDHRQGMTPAFRAYFDSWASRDVQGLGDPPLPPVHDDNA